jgi:uncharacterized membrane protein (UPF0127 family)
MKPSIRPSLYFAVFSMVAAMCFFAMISPSAWAEGRIETVTIETATSAVHFDCEIMRTDVEREQGLMFRPYLPELRGMLFDFGEERPVQMWMKDTLIPLDMLFIRANGTIARIIANAEPYSTRVLPSGEPVLAVLEINAGLAAKYKIEAGARVTHPLFSQ